MRSDRERLKDILESIAAIGRHSSGGRAAFESDELVRTALSTGSVSSAKPPADRVWEAVEHDLPRLERQVTALLDDPAIGS